MTLLQLKRLPLKKAKPVAKDSAGKSGVAPQKKAGSAPIKTEKKALVTKAKDSAKPKPAAAKAKAADVKVADVKPAAKAKAAEEKATRKKSQTCSESKNSGRKK